jgi:hypothetical protein
VNTPLVPSGFYEVMRREEDDRTLVCYANAESYIIANENDIANQSVVLTADEVRWLAEMWRGDEAEVERLTEERDRLAEWLTKIARPGEAATDISQVWAQHALTGDTVEDFDVLTMVGKPDERRPHGINAHDDGPSLPVREDAE